jgi:hypothetical protein
MTTPTVQAALDTLIEAIRAELREEFLSALGGASTAPKRGARKARRAAAAVNAAPRAKARAKGGKRTPEELEALTQNVLVHIKKNPGQRVEQIAAALGTRTKELALPIIKLGKALKTQGQRRGTKYTAR